MPLGDTGDLALEVLLALSIVVPLSVLIVVVHYFFKSARRFDVEQARASKAGEPSDAGHEMRDPHSRAEISELARSLSGLASLIADERHPRDDVVGRMRDPDRPVPDGEAEGSLAQGDRLTGGRGRRSVDPSDGSRPI